VGGLARACLSVQLVESALFPSCWLLCIPTPGLVKTRATHMPSTGTCAGSTHKRREGFLEFPPSTSPSTVCLALGCNTTVSLLTTVHASDSFSITSYGFGLVSIILGVSVSFPKLLKLLFVADLVHPGSTLQSREGLWEIETWVIRPLTLLYESFML